MPLNRSQKMVVGVAASLICASGIFVPWQWSTYQVSQEVGYGWIWQAPEGANHVDFVRVLLGWGVVVAAGGAAAVTLEGRRRAPKHCTNCGHPLS